MTGGALGASVASFVALLGGAVLVAMLAERLRIPAAVALVAAGIGIGAAHGTVPFPFGEALLAVFLPPLVFEAAWNLDLAALRGVAGRVALLAFPGTLLTAFIVAGGIAATGALPFDAALLFGAMVAATDPIAVIAVFRRVPVPPVVKTIVEAEALLNDGVALVLFGIALALASGSPVDPAGAAVHGVVAVAGGIALGAIAGFVCAFVVGTTDAAEYEVTVTIVLAYVSYLGADRFGMSGIFATAAGAVALRASFARLPRLIENDADVDHFWNATAFTANAVVFLATGMLIHVDRVFHEPALALIALAVLALARAALAVGAVADVRGRITVFLAGMRGALPLALALSLPVDVPHRPEIIDAVFATVLVTLVVQGAPLEPVLRRLYRGSGGPASSS